MSILEYFVPRFRQPNLTEAEKEKELLKSEIDRLFELCSARIASVAELLKAEGGNNQASAISDSLAVIDLLIADLERLSALLSETNRDVPAISAQTQSAAAYLRELKSCRQRAHHENGRNEQNIELILRLANSLLAQEASCCRELKDSVLNTAWERHKRVTRIQGVILLILLAGLLPYIVIQGSAFCKDYQFAQALISNITPAADAGADKYTNSSLPEVRDLYQISKALEKYYRDQGEYPMSSIGGERWDGLFSAWGESRRDWIKKLAPQYISELPRDRRQTDKPPMQYIYKSDRFAYKLGLNQLEPESLELIKRQYPEMLDRAGKQYITVGIWTKRAAKW